MYTIIIFTICLGILIFVHEFGHFIMARLKGIRVLKFSLGFGPKIIGKKVGDTEYVISALPLGGYVKMAGENLEEATMAPDEFPSKSVGDRASVVLAGPVMNIIIAFLLMPLVFLIGIKMPAFLEKSPVVAWIEEGSPAQVAGILVGDRIIKIDGKPMSNWEDVTTVISTRPELGIKLEVERGDSVQEAVLKSNDKGSKPGSGYAGMLPDMPAVIGKVSKGYPAERAGFRAGDRIVEVDNNAVVNWYQVSSYIRSNAGKELTLTVKRDEQKVTAKVTPVKDETAGHGIIGIMNRQETIVRKFGLIDSVKHGISKALELTLLTVDVLKRLVSLNISIETLGGPIMIAKLTGEAAQSGFTDLIAFLAFLSLQLGVLNLLPIPVLDGGWVVFLIIEKIKGSPLNRKTMEVAQTVGFALLIMLIIIVSYNDILRVFR